MRRLARFLYALASTAPAQAWVPTAVSYQDPGNTLAEVQAKAGAINRLWNLPADETSTHGFSSGISYAWDPELCDNLLPLFSEDISGIAFITCDSLRAAWSRALSTWSVHHPQISFTDVTAECERAGDLTGGPVNGEGCSFAQMWITTKSNSTGADVAATALSSYSWTTSFRHTTGRAASAGVYETVGSVIGFNIESPMCWYLDSLFCSRFHELKQKYGSDAVFVFGQVVLWGSWTIAMLSTMYVAYELASKHLQVFAQVREKNFERREKLLKAKAERSDDSHSVDEDALDQMREEVALQLNELLDGVSKLSIAWTTLRMLFVWAPPVIYVYIFLPCWECYDFEAAAAHEVGHALGLMHPDQAAEVGLNLGWNESSMVNGTYAAAECAQPWGEVVQQPAGSEAAASIMTAFTQFNSEVCLSEDDLVALNTLYPTCSHRVVTPQCYKAESYIGLVRVGVFVGLPVTLIVLTIIFCHACITREEAKRHEKMKSNHAGELSKMEQEIQKQKQHHKAHVQRGLARNLRKASVAPAAGAGGGGGAGGQQRPMAPGTQLALIAKQAKKLEQGGGGAPPPSPPSRAATIGKGLAARLGIGRTDPHATLEYAQPHRPPATATLTTGAASQAQPALDNGERGAAVVHAPPPAMPPTLAPTVPPTVPPTAPTEPACPAPASGLAPASLLAPADPPRLGGATTLPPLAPAVPSAPYAGCVGSS